VVGLPLLEAGTSIRLLALSLLATSLRDTRASDGVVVRAEAVSGSGQYI